MTRRQLGYLALTLAGVSAVVVVALVAYRRGYADGARALARTEALDNPGRGMDLARHVERMLGVAEGTCYEVLGGVDPYDDEDGVVCEGLE